MEEEDSDIEVEADAALCGRAFFTICRSETNTTDKDVLNADESGKAFLVSVKKWPILVLSKCFTSVWTPATKNNQLANQFGPNLIAIVAEHPDEIAILQ